MKLSTLLIMLNSFGNLENFSVIEVECAHSSEGESSPPMTTGWLSGNALDCGLDDMIMGWNPAVCYESFFFFSLIFQIFSKFFCWINSYSILLCPVTGTIDTA